MNIREKRKHEAFEWLRQLALLSQNEEPAVALLAWRQEATEKEAWQARAEELERRLDWLQNPPIRPWRDRAEMVAQLQTRYWKLYDRIDAMDEAPDADEGRIRPLRRRFYAIQRLLERLQGEGEE